MKIKCVAKSARFVGWGGVLSLAFGALTSVRAGDSTDYLIYKVGRITLRPLFEANETFNDNVYFQDKGATSDLISTVTPGLKAQLGQVDGNYFNVSFRHDQVFYADQTHLDASQNRFATKLFYDGAKVSIEGSDSYEMLSSPLGGGISTGRTVVDRNAMYDNYTVGYRLTGKTRAYLGLSNARVDYDKNLSLYDTFTLRGTLGAEYAAFAKVRLFGEVYYGQTDLEINSSTAPKPPTATFGGAFIGARGDFTEKLTGTLKVGYETRQFDDAGSTAQAGANEGLSSPVVEVDVSEQLTERSLLILTYQRSQQVSVEYTRTSLVLDSVHFIARQILGGSGKAVLSLNLGYSFSAFEPNSSFKERNDNLFDGSLTMLYNFRPWLVGFAGYSMQWFQSDLKTVTDYNLNRVTVGVNIGY